MQFDESKRDENLRPNKIIPSLAESSFCRPQELVRVSALRVSDWSEIFINDMARIYANAFSGAPWFEDWSPESAKAVLLEYIDKGADLVVVLAKSQDDQDVVAGVGIGMPLSKYEGQAELLAQGANENAYYIADLAVDNAFRRMGVCSLMLSSLEQLAIKASASAIVSRTAIFNEAMLMLFRKSAFAQIGSYEAKTGGVTSERIVFEKR